MRKSLHHCAKAQRMLRRATSSFRACYCDKRDKKRVPSSVTRFYYARNYADTCGIIARVNAKDRGVNDDDELEDRVAVAEK